MSNAWSIIFCKIEDCDTSWYHIMTVIRRRKPFHFCQILSPLGNIARVVQLFQRHKLVLNLVATAKLDNNLPNLDKCCPHLAKRAFPFLLLKSQVDATTSGPCYFTLVSLVVRRFLEWPNISVSLHFWGDIITMEPFQPYDDFCCCQFSVVGLAPFVRLVLHARPT